MLTEYEQMPDEQSKRMTDDKEAMQESTSNRRLTGTTGRRLSRMLKVEWLGQTAASLFWIASVLAYGISSTGDWLQLCAASAWLLANVAAIVAAEAG